VAFFFSSIRYSPLARRFVRGPVSVLSLVPQGLTRIALI